MQRRQLLWYSLLFAFGCTTGVNSDSNRSNQTAKVTPKSLKFAVTDTSGIKELEQDFGAFRQAFEEILGIKTEFYPVENYTAAAPAMLSGDIDIVFAGPSEYVILQSRAKPIPIIGIRRSNYHSLILVRADSKIKSLTQLKGKKIAMASIGSTSGHIAPTKLLIDAGLDPNTDLKILMLKDKGAQALKKGEVEAWAVSSNLYKNILENENLLEKDFVIIAISPPLPSDLFLGSNQLSQNFIDVIKKGMVKNEQKLIQSLLVAKANQKYEGSKFIPVNDADYNLIREVYKKIGQNEFLQ
jgi:phosphonate transport system substrate-binding protein